MSKLKKIIILLRQIGTFNFLNFIIGGFNNSKWKNEFHNYSILESNGYEVKNVSRKIYKVESKEYSYLLRRFTSDYKVFYQQFFEKEYYGLIKILQEKNIDVKNIVDAGANVGFSALYFSHFFSSATFFCIEPSKKNYLQLEENLKKNNIKHHALQMGLWNKKTDLYLDATFRDKDFWSLAVSEHISGGEPIRAIDLNTLMEMYSLETIDILKIDIEGSEFTVFSEKSDCSFLQKTKSIAIEIHEEINDASFIIAILKREGFRLAKSGEYYIGINKNIIP